MADTLVGHTPVVRMAVVHIPVVAGDVSDCPWRNRLRLENCGRKAGEELLRSFL